MEIFLSQCSVRWCVIREASRNCDLTLNFSCFKKPVRSCSQIMFYKMLFDRFVDFAYLYTILDMPRQIRIVCLHKDAVLCFVNNGLADKTSTEPGLDKIKDINRPYGLLISLDKIVLLFTKNI